MRVLICPDKFAGTISAVDAAAALAAGWRATVGGDQLVARPLADGGPGFLDVLAAATGARRVPVRTVDPLGRPVEGWVLVCDRSAGSAAAGGPVTAYVESAQACGLHLLAQAERDPMVTSSYGLGRLLAAAVAAGARELVVGLGGSATNDAGAGMLAALGAGPVDRAGHRLPPGGAALGRVAGLSGAPRLAVADPGPVQLVAATDVDHPLLGPHGATATFGPQKGATEPDLVLLERALARFAGVLERDLPGCPPGLAGLPGGGAAGGLGAALLALGGRRESGIGLVRAVTGLDAALAAADLVITGEGSFDQQSVRGKVVAGVAAAARDRAVPCVVVAGRVTLGRDEAAAAGVTEVHSLVEHLGSIEAAMADPARGLRELGARLAGTWSRTPPRD